MSDKGSSCDECDFETYKLINGLCSSCYEPQESAYQSALKKIEELEHEFNKYRTFADFLNDGKVETEVYDAAVKGRKDFRDAFRDCRSKLNSLTALNEKLEKDLKKILKLVEIFEEQRNAWITSSQILSKLGKSPKDVIDEQNLQISLEMEQYE